MKQSLYKKQKGHKKTASTDIRETVLLASENYKAFTLAARLDFLRAAVFL